MTDSEKVRFVRFNMSEASEGGVFLLCAPVGAVTPFTQGKKFHSHKELNAAVIEAGGKLYGGQVDTCDVTITAANLELLGFNAYEFF